MLCTGTRVTRHPGRYAYFLYSYLPGCRIIRVVVIVVVVAVVVADDKDDDDDEWAQAKNMQDQKETSHKDQRYLT